MTHDPLAHATWRTSSRSATHGQCVEIAQAPTVTGMCDSKNPTEGRLILTAAQPVVDIIDLSDRTWAGYSIAIVWATIPPRETPTRWALPYLSASSRPTVSAAMSDSVEDVDEKSPAS